MNGIICTDSIGEIEFILKHAPIEYKKADINHFILWDGEDEAEIIVNEDETTFKYRDTEITGSTEYFIKVLSLVVLEFKLQELFSE